MEASKVEISKTELSGIELSLELVEYVAELSRIKLDNEQTVKMQKELSAVIDYMNVLNNIDTTDVEPLSHVFAINNVLRKDEVKESFDRELLLKNAPVHTEESVVVPKTVE